MPAADMENEALPPSQKFCEIGCVVIAVPALTVMVDQFDAMVPQILVIKQRKRLPF